MRSEASSHISHLVELDVPAAAGFLRLIRLSAETVAAELGASVATTLDLRLAVDEACAVLIDRAAAHDRLHLSYRSYRVDGRRTLEAVVRSSARSGRALDLHPVAAAVLAWAVEHHELGADDDGHDRITLVAGLDR